MSSTDTEKHDNGRKMSSEAPGGTQAQILVVEDSPTQAMQLEYMLEGANYRVLLAQNGVEALASIRQHRPAVVISDIIMPRMDGYELCKRMKSDESLRDISLILLTTLSEPQDVIKSLQCGADKFLTKPYDGDLLLSTIKQLLSKAPSGTEETAKALEITYDGQQYSIDSGRGQILDLLVSTYEAAVRKNDELAVAEEDLRLLNRGLEQKVAERTADLQAKNEQLNIISQQLWQASKLATMGELAASIAHELNNPLATLNLRVESLLAQIPPDDPKRRALEVVEQELDRMANLVANLLQFSRRRSREVSTIDVCNEVDNTLELIHYHLRKCGIKVQKEYQAGILHIHADRQQLRQLFLNLFTNASDAMPHGGTLTIRAHRQGSGSRDQGPTPQGMVPTPDPRPPTPALTLTPDPEEAAFVVIEIIDTGTGIPPELLPKVMEPFFTTKPEGKGTGLGLPISRRVVQEHGGLLQIESSVGEGTTIRIRLPVLNGSNCTAGEGEEDSADG
jgi:signal transduction histidine kinase